MIEISVVVPTYNNEKVLKCLINSLSSQNYPKNKYEIIIVNDGSTDGTCEFAKNIINSNIVYLRQKHSGPAAARNRGISVAKGKIVAFIDDDCIASRGWLAAIKEGFKDEELEGLEGKTLADSGKIFPDSHCIRNLSGGIYLTCNIAFLGSVIKKMRFDENYRYPNREDSDVAFSVLKSGGKIGFSKKMQVKHKISKYGLKKMLKRKLYFESDVRLFRKFPNVYKKRIRFPFERFTPLYVIFSLASFLNQYFLLLLVITAIAEIGYRKYSFSPLSFIKFLVAQTAGSFVNIFAVLRGCVKQRVNPLRFF